MLTVRFTLPLCRRWVPAFGLCEITWPVFTLLDEACLIFPAEQKCALSARFAVARLSPLTFGTTQLLSVNFAVTLRVLSTLTLQVDFLPPQSPDQPAKAEPLEALALRVTDLPNAYLWTHVLGQWMPAGELVTLP